MVPVLGCVCVLGTKQNPCPVPFIFILYLCRMRSFDSSANRFNSCGSTTRTSASYGTHFPTPARLSEGARTVRNRVRLWGISNPSPSLWASIRCRNPTFFAALSKSVCVESFLIYCCPLSTTGALHASPRSWSVHVACLRLRCPLAYCPFHRKRRGGKGKGERGCIM